MNRKEKLILTEMTKHNGWMTSYDVVEATGINWFQTIVALESLLESKDITCKTHPHPDNTRVYRALQVGDGSVNQKRDRGIHK